MTKKNIIESFSYMFFTVAIFFIAFHIRELYFNESFVVFFLLLLISAYISSTLATSFNIVFYSKQNDFFDRKLFLIANCFFAFVSMFFLLFTKDIWVAFFIYLAINSFYLSVCIINHISRTKDS